VDAIIFFRLTAETQKPEAFSLARTQWVTQEETASRQAPAPLAMRAVSGAELMSRAPTERLEYLEAWDLWESLDQGNGNQTKLRRRFFPWRLC